jgi:uncharacterized membrane protein YkoI
VRVSFRKRNYWILAILAVAAILAVGGTVGAVIYQEAEATVPPGQIDDGADLLPQASIALGQAIAAAQTAVTGALGEVDLETYNGTLVFNVDIGAKDVKVDASNGAILGLVQDD